MKVLKFAIVGLSVIALVGCVPAKSGHEWHCKFINKQDQRPYTGTQPERTLALADAINTCYTGKKAGSALYNACNVTMDDPSIKCEEKKVGM